MVSVGCGRFVQQVCDKEKAPGEAESYSGLSYEDMLNAFRLPWETGKGSSVDQGS